MSASNGRRLAASNGRRLAASGRPFALAGLLAVALLVAPGVALPAGPFAPPAATAAEELRIQGDATYLVEAEDRRVRVVLAITATFQQLRVFQTVDEAGDRCAVDAQACGDLGTTGSVVFPQDLQDGVLRRRDAKGGEFLSGLFCDLLHCFSHEKADAVFNSVHSDPGKTS